LAAELVIGLNRKRGTLLGPRSRDVEQPDDLDDPSDKSIESGNYWLTNGPEGGGLCEAYLSGYIGIAWRRVETRVDREAPEWGPVIKVNRCSSDTFKPRKSGYPRRGNPRADRNEPFVLAQDVELVQRPQIRVASLVWLERFDRRSLAAGKPLFAFDTRDHVLFGPKNWKVRLLTRFYAVSYCERSADEIKRAASGIDDRASIADHERIDRALLVSYQNFISGVRIRLHDKLVWAVPLPGKEALLQDWDLGYGSINRRLGV
jgi:hypothetical protein